MLNTKDRNYALKIMIKWLFKYHFSLSIYLNGDSVVNGQRVSLVGIDDGVVANYHCILFYIFGETSCFTFTIWHIKPHGLN